MLVTLLGHKFSQLPSSIIGLKDEVVSLDFNILCLWKLLQWEGKNESSRRKDEAQLFGAASAAAFNGKMLEFDDESNLNEIPEAP